MKKGIGSVLVLGFIVAAPAFGTNLSAYTSITQTPGPFVTDRGTPITDSEDLATGNASIQTYIGEPYGPSYYGDGYAFALADDDNLPDTYRKSAVTLAGIMFDDAEAWDFESVADTSLTIQNSTGVDQNYFYYYDLDAFDLIIDGFSETLDGVGLVGFEFELVIGGVSEFAVSASLEGNVLSTATLTTDGPLGTPTFFQNPAHPNTEYGYTFDEINESAFLGTLSHGESLTIETHMRAYLHMTGVGFGGAVFGARHEGFVESSAADSPPVPEPASAVLLGMGCLGALARNRKRRVPRK